MVLVGWRTAVPALGIVVALVCERKRIEYWVQAGVWKRRIADAKGYRPPKLVILGSGWGSISVPRRAVPRTDH